MMCLLIYVPAVRTRCPQGDAGSRRALSGMPLQHDERRGADAAGAEDAAARRLRAASACAEAMMSRASSWSR
jgi:hypothetical protein